MKKKGEEKKSVGKLKTIIIWWSWEMEVGQVWSELIYFNSLVTILIAEFCVFKSWELSRFLNVQLKKIVGDFLTILQIHFCLR